MSTTKKVFLGCGLVLGLFALLCCGGGLYMGMKAKQFLGMLEDYGTRFTQLETRFPFSEPADGVIEDDRVAAYFAVREHMTEFARSNPAIMNLHEAVQGGKNPGPLEAFRMAMLALKAVGDEAVLQLENNSMSPKEYLYIAGQVYSSLDSGANEGNADLAELRDKFREVMDTTAKAIRSQNQAEHAVEYDDAVATLEQADEETKDRMIGLLEQHKEAWLKSPYMAYVELYLLGKQ